MRNLAKMLLIPAGLALATGAGLAGSATPAQAWGYHHGYGHHYGGYNYGGYGYRPYYGSYHYGYRPYFGFGFSSPYYGGHYFRFGRY